MNHASRFTADGHELIVVAPDIFWYSGLATGMLGGIYPPELDRINPAHVLGGSGRFIMDRVVGLDLNNRVLELAKGISLDFDVLSIDLGSNVRPIPGTTHRRVFAVKPIRNLCDLRSEIELLARSDQTRRWRIAIAGGGVTAFEVATNLVSRVHQCGGATDVNIYASDNKPLAQLPKRAARRILQYSAEQDITLRPGSHVERIDDGELHLSNGETFPFDIFVNATGLIPSTSLRHLGLELNEEGALVVDSCLQARGVRGVFAGGDCIAFKGEQLPKLGVFAIRQAPILLHNLRATLAGRPLRQFHPQKHYLSIMALGNGRGLAVRGSWWWEGRAAFWLKDFLDRRFLRSMDG
jgi:NADH dehydrogenase FAD-containing subunit